MTRRAQIVFLLVLGITVAADQASKAWAHTLPAGAPQPVIDGYWDWTLSANPGAAFSTFDSSSPAVRVGLALVAAVALALIARMAWRSPPTARAWRVGLALVGGGALGNLIDRVRLGTVTDFIQWRVHDHRWPVFNVADAALLVGVVVLLWAGAFKSRARAGAGAMLTT